MVRFASRPRGKIYPSLINPSRVATIATLVFRHLERIELDGWRRDFIEEETTLVVARGRSRDGANRVYLTKIRGNEINGVEIHLFFFFFHRGSDVILESRRSALEERQRYASFIRCTRKSVPDVVLLPRGESGGRTTSTVGRSDVEGGKEGIACFIYHRARLPFQRIPLFVYHRCGIARRDRIGSIDRSIGGKKEKVSRRYRTNCSVRGGMNRRGRSEASTRGGGERFQSETGRDDARSTSRENRPRADL